MLAVVAVIGAGVLGLQALGNVLAKREPDLALSVAPTNASAREQEAFREFQARAVTQQEAGPDAEQAAETAIGFSSAARQAMEPALQAFRSDPLAPKAHAVFAFATEDAAARRAILEAASSLNRRDIALQGAMLDNALERGDYPMATTTIDRILRVHPERENTFFPVLRRALKVPAATPLFADLLDGGSLWHRQFLLQAVKDPEARLPLASIRPDLRLDDPEFDRRLIAGLATQGEFDAAARIYRRLGGQAGTGNSAGKIDWASDFVPFDWSFVDERSLRAQPSRDEERLEIFARAGSGGVVARRVIPVPAGVDRLVAKVETVRELPENSLRLAATCAGAGAELARTELFAGMNTLSIAERPQDCRQLVVAIEARAFAGYPLLRAEIERLALR